MAKGSLRWKLVVLVLLFLAGCASAPQLPLMSPLSEAGRYGYTDIQTGADNYRVTYIGPSRYTVASRSGREDASDAAKEQAYDLALWRASQLAIDSGFPGFRISDSDIETEVTIRQGYYPYYSPSYYRFGYYNRPFYPYYPYYGLGGYPPYGTYRDTSLRAIATLNIAMTETLGVQDIDAEATIRRLAAKYPEALGAPNGSPSASSPPSGY